MASFQLLQSVRALPRVTSLQLCPSSQGRSCSYDCSSLAENSLYTTYDTAAVPDRKIIFSLVTKGHVNAHTARQQALNFRAVIWSDVWFPPGVTATPASLAFLPLATSEVEGWQTVPP